MLLLMDKAWKKQDQAEQKMEPVPTAARIFIQSAVNLKYHHNAK